MNLFQHIVLRSPVSSTLMCSTPARIIIVKRYPTRSYPKSMHFISNMYIFWGFLPTALRKLYFHFLLSHWMGYDPGDIFRFDFEPNGNPFGSKSKRKLSPRSYPIQCEKKWKYNFLSVSNMYIFWDFLPTTFSLLQMQSCVANGCIYCKIFSVFFWIHNIVWVVIQHGNALHTMVYSFSSELTSDIDLHSRNLTDHPCITL